MEDKRCINTIECPIFRAEKKTLIKEKKLNTLQSHIPLRSCVVPVLCLRCAVLSSFGFNAVRLDAVLFWITYWHAVCRRFACNLCIKRLQRLTGRKVEIQDAAIWCSWSSKGFGLIDWAFRATNRVQFPFLWCLQHPSFWLRSACLAHVHILRSTGLVLMLCLVSSERLRNILGYRSGNWEEPGKS